MYEITLYGQSNCADCQTAKDLLNEHSIPFLYCDIKQIEGYADFREDFSTERSVPQLYDEVYKKPIGNLEALRTWLNRPSTNE